MTDDTRKSPTSFDVARRAGVSRSTVSRAFTDGAKISGDVRRKVLEAAEELGYHVNYLARGLQTKHSNLVGIVASRLDTPIRSVQVKSLAQTLLHRGLQPILLMAEDAADVGSLLNSLFRYNVAGMIVTSDTPPASIIDECNRLAIPVVLINRDLAITGADRVQMDPVEAGRLAFEMLASRGVTQFAVLSPASRTFSVSGRADAFAERCKKEGVPVVRFEAENQSYLASLRAGEALAAAVDRYDGLFCATDLMAMGVLDALRHRHGVDVPGALQVVGFDDIEQASWLAYDLSTIRHDLADQARLAVELMLARLDQPDRDYDTRTQSLEPVFRATTRGLASP